MENLIEQMKANAKAHNKFLTDEGLAKKFVTELCNNVHPSDSFEYAKKLEKLGFIDDETKKSLDRRNELKGEKAKEEK